MSSLGYCPDLSGYLVDLATLACTEYHYKVPVQFTVIVKGKSSNKVNDNPATPDIIKLITAVANSSGGVVSLSCQGACDNKVIKNWMHEFKSKLKTIFPQDEFVNNIIIDYERSTGQITWVHILIKKSVNPIIYDYGLYQRSDEENLKVMNNETAAKLMKAKSRTFVEQTCSSSEWHKASGVSENRNTELKCWKTKNVVEIINRLKDDRNENSIFAFLNNPEGGMIFIGITDDNNMIEGQNLSVSEEATLITAIEEILSEDKTGQKRIWGTTEQAPARGTYWDVKIDEVHGDPGTHRRVVIKILLKHYPGGVFKHIPQTFNINEDGKVTQFTVEVWQEVICQISDTHQETPESPFEANIQRAKAAVESFKKKSGDKSLQSKTTHLKESTSIDQIDSTSLHISLKQEQRLSFTENTNDWRDYITVGREKISDFLNHTSNLLQVEQSPLTFLPDEQTIVAYGNKTDNIRQCISEIEKVHGSTQGTAIASKEWLKLIMDDSSTLPKAPQSHVIDIVSFDSDCNINVWVVFDAHPSDASPYEYVRNIGRVLKFKLMSEINHRLVPSVNVQSRLFIAGKLCSSSYLDQVCRKFFTPNPDQQNVLRQIICTLLLKKQTSIRTTIGDQCLITLTLHQASQSIGSDLAQFTQVHGGPGTGKTILLLYLSKHVFSKDNCVILCANNNLKAYFDYQNTSQSEIINTDKEMIFFLESDLFQSKLCLLIDDCQLLSLKKETWFAVFERIKLQDKVLFVFSDNEIQNYDDSDTHVKCSDVVVQYHQHQAQQQDGVVLKTISLKEVHRNCQKVASFLSKTIQTGNNSPLQCAHDEVGDDVEVLRVERLRDQGPDNGLVQLIESLTDPVKLLSGADDVYDAKHVAVLIDRRHTQNDVELFKKILNKNGFQTQDADRFPRTDIIITSVKSFSGLDAKVVLIIIPEEFSTKDDHTIKLGLHNDKYKAAIASRGIFRVIFVVDENLSPSIMNAMKMDKLSSVVKYRPDYNRVSIRHSWFLRTNILFSPYLSVCPVTGRVMVSSHDQLFVMTAALDHVHTITVEGSRLLDVAVSRKGHIYVTDLQDKLHIINQSDWSYITLGSNGTGPGQFHYPCGVFVSTTEEVYVVDCFNYRVQVMEPGGTFLRQFGSKGSAPGQFLIYPLSISVSSTGTVAVSDRGENITLFTEAGEFIRKVTLVQPGRSVMACMLFHDSRDNLLMTDPTLGVVVLGPDMKMLTVVDKTRVRARAIWDVAVAPDGSWLVSVESGNDHCVYVLDVPHTPDSDDES